jgi:hypothetical protein
MTLNASCGIFTIAVKCSTALTGSSYEIKRDGGVMDDLDREIEEAARAARQRVWRGRIATIASIATFFLVGILGAVAMIELFPGESHLRMKVVPVAVLAFASAYFVSKRLAPTDQN